MSEDTEHTEATRRPLEEPARVLPPPIPRGPRERGGGVDSDLEEVTSVSGIPPKWLHPVLEDLRAFEAWKKAHPHLKLEP